jgi:hypothetical protein
MSIRAQDLEGTGAVIVTFDIHQTAGVDDLKSADIGKAVKQTASYEIGPVTDGCIVLGKLISLTLMDSESTVAGKRKASVQIGGVVTLLTSATYPVIGNKVVGGEGATVKQAPVLVGYDPAGGNIARGSVLAVNGTVDCTLLLT